MFGKKKSTVGLDIGSSSIKVVEILHDRSGDRLINYGVSEPLSEAIVDGEIMDRQLVTDAISNLLDSRGIKSRQVVAAVRKDGSSFQSISTSPSSNSKRHRRAGTRRSRPLP